MPPRILPGLAILVVLTLCSTASASEPDGRVAFRYDWPDKDANGETAPRLRLTVTAFVDLVEARLDAALPKDIGLNVRAAGRAPARWPEKGLAVGDLSAGQTIVIDLDVTKPAGGGGIVGFTLQATSGGRTVREGVGVSVGEPGTAPTLRNGAVEFPAAREEPAP